ncbi:MAG: zf-HC2 domain-containing protein [Candidatus Marinimicrobia bacterium]|nr:zf-HC2 domain-containing protein [FCB group bacterium]MBL7026332.1 zf-HC2 domain-containing protein [Candidatus Neomarinimicrobiota bacterium]
MKHEKWIRSLHLLREGELPPEEQQALDTHLTMCEHCSSIYEQVQLDWLKAIGEIAAEPQLQNPEQLTDDIFLAINENESQAAPTPLVNREDREPIFYSQSFRLGLQVASLVFLAIFFIEQFQVTNSVQKLEIQLQSQKTYQRYAGVNMIPLMFREQVLEMTRVQLEKRGLPSARIEVLIHNLEMNTPGNELRREDLGRIGKRLANQWKTVKLKGVNAYWRQP